ncbi:DUF4390 domain-containing protein [Ramlibacter humi]|uniref:DUF4390 domain-containing protein n=1 Tax=Ramlibacter humi TaxID=2530451 RepID=A0A4Z0BZN7_9BURK|nr:DUF4390 domain-containing protein [Ramlibacter humi]
MDFFTACWRRLEQALRLLALAGLLAGTAVRADAPEVTQLRLERSDEGVLLSASVKLELPAAVEDALLKGIPMFFVADASLMRDRWYWYDKHVTGASRHMRLSFQPLTRRWRLQVSSGPIGNAGLSLGQTFDSQDEALAAVRNISRWKIAELGDLEPDARYSVDFRFRLDVSQLPRPFQIGAVGQSDWSLVASRTQRLAVESPR